MVFKAIKKPIVNEVIQFDGTKQGFKEIEEWAGVGIVQWMDLGFSHVVVVHTLEGNMVLRKGDFIVKGIKGEVYSVNREIFLETYDMFDEMDF